MSQLLVGEYLEGSWGSGDNVAPLLAPPGRGNMVPIATYVVCTCMYHRMRQGDWLDMPLGLEETPSGAIK